MSDASLGPVDGALGSVDAAVLLLDQARAIVAGARRKAYGTPEDNFACIAGLWTTYLRRRFPAQITRTGPDGRVSLHPIDLTAADVAVLMVLMKCARLAESPAHADSWRDTAGYAACGARASGADLG